MISQTDDGGVHDHECDSFVGHETIACAVCVRVTVAGSGMTDPETCTGVGWTGRGCVGVGMSEV